MKLIQWIKINLDKNIFDEINWFGIDQMANDRIVID